ncbi:hypothetical protein ACWGBV_02875 [Streptomyces sp. NPDC055051]
MSEDGVKDGAGLGGPPRSPGQTLGALPGKAVAELLAVLTGLRREGVLLKTFKARTLAVFKGTLPPEAEIGLPEGAAAQVQADGRYEVSVTGPEDDAWLARLTRPRTPRPARCRPASGRPC